MADQKEKPVNVKYGSPGLSGAIKDVVDVAVKAFGPRSVVQRKQKLQDQEDESLGRMREGQSTDSNNNY